MFIARKFTDGRIHVEECKFLGEIVDALDMTDVAEVHDMIINGKHIEGTFEGYPCKVGIIPQLPFLTMDGVITYNVELAPGEGKKVVKLFA
jgi:hypothetical protein